MVEVINKFNIVNQDYKSNQYNIALTDKMVEISNNKNASLDVNLYCDGYVCYYKREDFGKLSNYVLMFDYPSKDNIENIILNYEYFVVDLVNLGKNNTVSKVIQSNGKVLEAETILGELQKPIVFEEDSLSNLSKLRVYNTFFIAALQKNLITLEEYQEYVNKNYKIASDMYYIVNYNENLLYESMARLNESCNNALIIKCSSEDFISDKAKLLLENYNERVAEYKINKEILGYEVLNRGNMKDFFNAYRDGKNMSHPYLTVGYKKVKLPS